MRDVLTTITVVLAIVWFGWFVSRQIRSYRRQRHAHRQMCTAYNRCPECRAEAELPSRLDLWDRFR